MKTLLKRFILLAAAIAAMSLLGIADLNLPLDDPDFQVSGAIVLLYLIWSAQESSYGRREMNLSMIGLYATLLVSVLDSFLIRATVFHILFGRQLILVRWVGVIVFLTGFIMRWIAVRKSSKKLLTAGRIWQLIGIPSALGSIAGLVVGCIPGVLSARYEQLPEDTGKTGEDS